MIYTSGSTGEPKGVLIEHRSFLHYCNEGSSRYIGKSTDEVALFFSNYTFDGSLEPIGLSILSGNKLVILPKDLPIGITESYDYLNQHGLTFLNATPSQCQLIDFSRLKHMKTLLVGGEAFTKTHFDHIRSGFNGLIINAYGPSEATIACFAEKLPSNEEYKNCLGFPLSYVCFYILDENLRLVPRGAIGELYITGKGLARGYLNRNEENAKSFILNPFLSEEEKRKSCELRLYKTSDFVRMNYLGQIEYIGRNDSQVLDLTGCTMEYNSNSLQGDGCEKLQKGKKKKKF